MANIRYPYCQVVLPAVFDDSLSYYEQVCKLVKAINDTVNFVNSAISDFENTSQQYTDEKIAQAFAEIRQDADRLNSQYQDFTTRVNLQISLINQRIEKQDDVIKAGIASAVAAVDNAIALNNEYILDMIASELVDIKVINYFTGEKVTIQEMFDYLAQYHLTNSINYEQLAARNKTYTQLAAYDMTYTDLVNNGNTIIA